MSDRTPQEREAARREREARRAGTANKPVSRPPMAKKRASPPPTAEERVPPPPIAEERVPPPPIAEERVSPPPTADEPVLPPLPAFAPPDHPASPAPDRAFVAFDLDPDGVHEDAEHEIPSGVKRVRGPRTGAVTRRPTTRPGRAGRLVRAPRAARPAGQRRSLLPRVLAVVALVLAITAIWFLFELFQPFHGSGHGRVVVTVPSGATAGTIGDQLARDGVVSSGFFFSLRATLAGDRGSLRAGVFRLQHGMTYGAALSVLTTPPEQAPTTNVTIIPGRTRRQIAVLLHHQGVHGRYLTSTRHTTLLNLRAYGAPRNLDNLEGFLFPSTYQLRDPISIPALVADQLTTFRQQFATVNMSYARSKNLTPYDVLIIASMVEAEAGTAHDRPLIASVIYNRLRQGIPLGIDATVRYAVNNYTTPLTLSQLSSSSPYNTRSRAGLTPTPIDNPSLASIEAAAHPARTGYLYFVAKPCGNGASAFASTNAQFQLDVQAYNQARANRGGRSPVTCKG